MTITEVMPIIETLPHADKFKLIHNGKRFQMEVITLNIYNDTVKNEILGFLTKFKPQEAEIQITATMPVTNQVTAHPFFGMLKESQETVEETIVCK